LQKRGSVGWSEGVGDSRIIGFGYAFSFQWVLFSAVITHFQNKKSRSTKQGQEGSILCT
jgi:hypothetical protein